MNVFKLSPEVRETLNLSRKSADEALTTNLSQDTRFLLALAAKAERTGSPVYVGISTGERARRRTRGRVAKASRKANRP